MTPSTQKNSGSIRIWCRKELTELVLGVIPGILCGVVTCGIGFFLVNPYLPAYFGTSIVIVLLTALCRRLNMFRSLPLAIAGGLLIALGAALASAPVTALLFGGATLSGVDAITTFFVSSGNALLESVLYAGLTSEPVNKILVCLIAFGVLRALPRSFFSENGMRGHPIPPLKTRGRMRARGHVTSGSKSPEGFDPLPLCRCSEVRRPPLGRAVPASGNIHNANRPDNALLQPGQAFSRKIKHRGEKSAITRA